MYVQCHRDGSESLQAWFPLLTAVLSLQPYSSPQHCFTARARKVFSAGYCVQMPPTLEKHAGQPNAEANHPPLITLPYWET